MIVVVSGLPRSGTSLMMQMLAAGGLPVLTDAVRAADADNPRGYYEWERIKLLPREPECVAEAEGKVVKVVSPLLQALPFSHEYRVVFLRRPLAEVLASQAAMIARRGAKGAALSEAQMLAAMESHLKQIFTWMELRQNLTFRLVNYRDLVEFPRREAERMCDFLQTSLDVDAMAAQVMPSLYRQRSPLA